MLCDSSSKLLINNKMGGVTHISYKDREVSHFSNVRFSICSLKIVSLLSLPLLFGLVNSNITLDKSQLLDTTYLFLYNSHLTHDSNYMGCTKINVTIAHFFDVE